MAERPPEADTCSTSSFHNDLIFKIRFTAKLLQRESRKKEKLSKRCKQHCLRALSQCNEDVAYKHAKEKVQLDESLLHDLRLSSRLEAVASKLYQGNNNPWTRGMRTTAHWLTKLELELNFTLPQPQSLVKLLDEFDQIEDSLSTMCVWYDHTPLCSVCCTQTDKVQELLVELKQELRGEPQTYLHPMEQQPSNPCVCFEGMDLEARLAALRGP
eukprot:TRINITY_DN44867_c0_g1_i1.p1 TRINITY_DN44867_c0_g1~~TRINITY_DN44867_c0_g1_i1.p1  ORF type:complete len:214 (+),score=24.03 TRINITY_DN44867_c0_g1_i1:68-709(+)